MKHTARQVQFRGALDPHRDQYTCVATIGNKVVARARDGEGNPLYVEQKYMPVYYMPLPKTEAARATHWGFDGTPLIAKQLDNVWESKKFIDQSRIPVYGNIQHEYMLLADSYGAQEIVPDMDRLYIWNIDIEVDSEDGFATPEDPFAEVTAITVKWRHMGKAGIVVYGCKAYTPKPDELYVKCDNENELLLRFLDDFRSAGDYPDILTGWNINGFDIPYLTKRMEQLFTEETWARLSPFDRVQDKTVLWYGQKRLNIDLKGIQILDYIEVYRKFTLSQRENYRLDTIASIELGERKLSYKEYQSLRRLYKENYQLFMEYNVRDVELVDKLDQKKKLIELVCALAYGAKSNFVDTFKQVRLWDIMIYHKLRADGKQIPPRPQNATKDRQYEGAFVKDPIVGMHNWVCSFDVASMYPHIIREWNLSPETKLHEKVTGLTVNGLLAQQTDTEPIKAKDMCMAANGVLTDRYKEGFIPEMLKTLYDERIRFKKLMQQAKRDADKEADPVKKAALKKQADAYNNQQSVRKVNLNSAYGAMGSEYFRFYDTDLAEAVTVTGQLIIRWVAKDINTYLNALFKTTDDYIIASDTDSVYVRMEKVAALIGDVPVSKKVDALNAFCDKKIQPIIDKTFVDIAEYMHVATPCLSMVRDVIADKAVWTAKKRYIMNVHDSEGTRYKTPELKMMGIEAIKSSTPSIVRKMITTALQTFMTGQQPDLWAYIENCEKEFRAAQFEDISFPRSCNGITKHTRDDKSLPIHVAGALTYNDHLVKTGLSGDYEAIRNGEKVKFAYLREGNPFGSHVIAATQGCPPEWEIEKWLDYTKQFNKTLIEPLNAILTCAGWNTEEVPALW